MAKIWIDAGHGGDLRLYRCLSECAVRPATLLCSAMSDMTKNTKQLEVLVGVVTAILVTMMHVEFTEARGLGSALLTYVRSVSEDFSAVRDVCEFVAAVDVGRSVRAGPAVHGVTNPADISMGHGNALANLGAQRGVVVQVPPSSAAADGTETNIAPLLSARRHSKWLAALHTCVAHRYIPPDVMAAQKAIRFTRRFSAAATTNSHGENPSERGYPPPIYVGG